MLPAMEAPRVLDVGCGTGPATFELAKLTGGAIIAIDTHRPHLDELERKAEQRGLQGRVQTRYMSTLDMDYPDESFDIIWADGSIYILGFERGLRGWRQLLRPGGFMAVHDVVWLQPDSATEIHDYWQEMCPDIASVDERVESIQRQGYRLLGHFTLPEQAWWDEYYGPLEQRIDLIQEKYADDPDALAVLAQEQREVDMYRRYSAWYGSAFFVMQKMKNTNNKSRGMLSEP